ncbi:ATP-binding protein [Shewanella sp.]|uniref:hybrid sensor histidine kinase/response regulator n=1 Tax=Shewanella sp. TaxID=50422 RepID=UPI0035618348
MDSGTHNILIDSRQPVFEPALLAELGGLQARFIRGEDVILPLCRTLSEFSEAQAVLLVEHRCVNDEEMPASASCWCRDSVRYLTLWKDVRDWPFAQQEGLVHHWHKFVVWPVKHTDLLIFFHSPKDSWFGFLLSFGDLLADILMGIFTRQSLLWSDKKLQLPGTESPHDMFRAIVSNSDDLILAVKQLHQGSSEIVYANAAAVCISLYPRSQLVGLPLAHLFPKGVQANGSEVDLCASLSASRDFSEEIYCRKANGEHAFLHLRVVALEQDNQGGLFALIGRDYTEFRAMELAVSRTQKMQAIGQLVGGIAHDFNNILGVLKGNLELMELKSTDENLVGYLEPALKACQRGTELTRRLLQFSRQEQFNAKHCQVNEVIESLQDLFSKSLTSQIQLRFEPGADIMDIKVDRGDLEDALLNMVLNAKDAMAGEGGLTISTGVQELAGFLPGLGAGVSVEAGLYVWISIKDSGHGIPLPLIEKIFEPFFSTKDKSKGTGLGLAMTYGFVKRSKGYMNVIATSPAGTEIRLWFPAVKSGRPVAVEPLEKCTSIPQVFSPLKAILVDDEPALLRVVSDYCQLMGMEVELFNDAKSVRNKYISAPCDAGLLVTDVLMPGGMNGYELASELGELHQIPALLISGFLEDIGIEKQDDMPFKVLHKPFDLFAFANALAEVGIRFAEKE